MTGTPKTKPEAMYFPFVIKDSNPFASTLGGINLIYVRVLVKKFKK